MLKKKVAAWWDRSNRIKTTQHVTAKDGTEIIWRTSRWAWASRWTRAESALVYKTHLGSDDDDDCSQNNNKNTYLQINKIVYYLLKLLFYFSLFSFLLFLKLQRFHGRHNCLLCLPASCLLAACFELSEWHRSLPVLSVIGTPF